ncbi:DUF421 domain-containing protein [Phenylobacterium immobile]|uniref:DUF421 domain-containing protein n=1 Tax=Phenylobacterium immobile TaxID=21 RepID=UPI000AA19AF0|nr:YetF domain-containing protein [Phenylobacterium immobile]
MDLLYDLIGRHGETITWSQMSARALLIFLIGLAFVRLAGERVFGKWGALDILLAIIIGSNLSRTITGGAPFFPTLCATAVLIGVHALLAYAATWWPLGDLLKGRPTQLVADGQIDWRAMRRHGVGQGDLDQALRQAGQMDLSAVKAVFLERNGDLSVILRA